jgi:hypothetical protein
MPFVRKRRTLFICLGTKDSYSLSEVQDRYVDIYDGGNVIDTRLEASPIKVKHAE